MTVESRSRHRRGGPAARRLAARAADFLARLGRPEADLSIAVVSDAIIRTLNRRWLGKDRATDVLSFPLTVPPGRGPHLGDVVVSLDTALRRARRRRKALARELDRYLAHGLLHLLGHDHQRPAQLRKMAAAEEALIGAPGLAGEGGLDGEGGRPGGHGPDRPARRARTPRLTGEARKRVSPRATA